VSDTRATITTEAPPTAGTPRPRWVRFVTALASDVGIALLWAALITAIVLFSGVVSQFAYVDF
jgi:uncharacterized RDD family membrane protein YckC